jgi:hypothetical protein
MKAKADTPFVALNIAVLTVSDTRTFDTDTSGQMFVDRLSAAGHRLAERVLLKDDLYKIRAQVATWIADDSVQVVLITGGTGLLAATAPRRWPACWTSKWTALASCSGRFPWPTSAPPPCNRAPWPAGQRHAGVLPAGLDQCRAHRLGRHPRRTAGCPPSPVQLRPAPEAGSGL